MRELPQAVVETGSPGAALERREHVAGVDEEGITRRKDLAQLAPRVEEKRAHRVAGDRIARKQRHELIALEKQGEQALAQRQRPRRRARRGARRNREGVPRLEHLLQRFDLGVGERAPGAAAGGEPGVGKLDRHRYHHMRAFDPRLAKLDALRGGSENLQRGAKIVGETLEARMDPLLARSQMSGATPPRPRAASRLCARARDRCHRCTA